MKSFPNEPAHPSKEMFHYENDKWDGKSLTGEWLSKKAYGITKHEYMFTEVVCALIISKSLVNAPETIVDVACGIVDQYYVRDEV